MPARRLNAQRLAYNLLRLGDVFSFSGASGGPDEPGDGDVIPVPPEMHGIQTEQGQDIETEGGVIIQAENQ